MLSKRNILSIMNLKWVWVITVSIGFRPTRQLASIAFASTHALSITTAYRKQKFLAAMFWLRVLGLIASSIL